MKRLNLEQINKSLSFIEEYALKSKAELKAHEIIRRKLVENAKYWLSDGGVAITKKEKSAIRKVDVKLDEIRTRLDYTLKNIERLKKELERRATEKSNIKQKKLREAFKNGTSEPTKKLKVLYVMYTQKVSFNFTTKINEKSIWFYEKKVRLDWGRRHGIAKGDLVKFKGDSDVHGKIISVNNSDSICLIYTSAKDGSEKLGQPYFTKTAYSLSKWKSIFVDRFNKKIDKKHKLESELDALFEKIKAAHQQLLAKHKIKRADYNIKSQHLYKKAKEPYLERINALKASIQKLKMEIEN